MIYSSPSDPDLSCRLRQTGSPSYNQCPRTAFALYPFFCQNGLISRKKTTVYLDEGLLRKAKVSAARSGKHDYEVIEAALQRYLGLEVVDRVWERNAAQPLDPDEALALAYEELEAVRAEHGA